MKITEDYARKVIEEVAPLVEEESQLKTDLKECEIVMFKNHPLDNPSRRIIGEYSPFDNSFLFPNKFRGNGEAFKMITSHELTHNAQFSTFPKLLETDLYYTKYFGVNKISPTKKLIEGDAMLVERNIGKKYFKNAKGTLWGIPLIPIKILEVDKFSPCANILEKKFNGNRKDINELYTAPIEELVKIFGGNEK